MRTSMPRVDHFMTVALTWTVVWLAAMLLMFATIAIVDPASIDPGDTQGMIMVMGPMGFFSGLLFAIVAGIGEESRSAFGMSFARAAQWGFIGTAIVQLFYLGHGDAGLIENLKMALLFAVIGSIVSVAWLSIARRFVRVSEKQSA